MKGLAAVASLLVAALAAGCGGGSDDALTKAELIAAGDRICRAIVEESAAITPPASPDDVGRFLDEVVRIAEEARDDFADLDPPDDAEELHEAMVTALEDGIEGAEEAATAADEGDMATATERLEAAQEAGASADADAKAYGFLVCGSEDELAEER